MWSCVVAQPIYNCRQTSQGEWNITRNSGVRGPCRVSFNTRRCKVTCQEQGNKDGKPEQPRVGVFSKGVWFAAEALGNIASFVKRGDTASLASTERTSDVAPISREDALKRLETDYSRDYFVSGDVDLDLYNEDCLFADDFASFRGLQRFKSNLDNLGSFISDYQVRLLDLSTQSKYKASLLTQL